MQLNHVCFSMGHILELVHSLMHSHLKTVAPCIVATRLSGFKDSQVNFFIVDAVHYARAAVATIGILKFTYGCLSHELQVCSDDKL